MDGSSSVQMRCLPIEMRFWAKVQKTDGCWMWTGSIGVDGYARFRHGAKGKTAYRYSYIIHKGPIPAGMEIDHLCRNRACVRPDHLEAVTTHENWKRGYGPSAINARKVACPKGHPYSLRDKRGYRICGECMAARQRAWFVKKVGIAKSVGLSSELRISALLLALKETEEKS